MRGVLGEKKGWSKGQFVLQRNGYGKVKLIDHPSFTVQGGFLLRHDFEKSQKVPKDPLFSFFLWRLLDTEIMLGFPAPRLFGRSQ